MIKAIIQFVCLGVSGHLATAAETNQPALGVRVETFSAWDNALILSGGDCKAVLVPAVGGRVLHYSLNGDNILAQEPDSGGKTLAGTPEGFAVGGYQCDLGPGSRGIADHKALWLGAWRWTTPRPYLVSLQSEADPAVGIQLSKEIMMDPDSGQIGLQQRMTSVSKGEVAFCLWDRTVCRGGGFALLPLNRKSRLKAGWSMQRRDTAGKLSYDASPPADPRVRVLDHVLVMEAKGAALTLGADLDEEWIAYTVGRLLFVKYFPCFPKGTYPEGGHAALVSCDERRAELQPLSPEVKLKPGESYVFPEKWALQDLERSANSFAEARALVKRIPPSPFKK
jgi:hypothetical protein